jgi:exonuclease SbcD
MRFLHLADLHLGKTLGDFDLRDDQRYILKQILAVAESKQVDAVLIAGDVFDKTVPSEGAVQILDEFIRALVKHHLQVYMISGNHDSDERLNFGSSLFEANDVHIAAKYQGELFHHVAEDAYGMVHIYQLPFVKASQVKRAFPDAKIETYEDAVREVLSHAEIDPAQRNILIAHQFVSGKGKDPTLGGSEGALTQHVGTVEKIGYDSFGAFCYVALGHIHSSQSVGREEVRYAGSPLKYSLSEAGSVKQIPGGMCERDGAKQVPIVTVDGEGQVTIELEKLVPMRDLVHIRGAFADIVKDENLIENTQDFVYVTLTDEDVIPDAMRIMRQYYPNTIKLDYDNSRTRELAHVDVVQATQSRSYEDLIADFYKQMYGVEISEEEMNMMKDVAKEVGIYEAD